MDTLYARCAGVDVHKKNVVVCLRCISEGGRVTKEVRTFATMTRNLLELADWLAEQGVTHVAMESTGVYWKPVHNLLEDRFTVVLVNAQYLKKVPGRKTDVKDCEWIAQLMQHGLLRSSFIPPRPIRDLRDLTRQRAQLYGEQTRCANRIYKVLQDANVKLSSVATDVLGTSGRDMLAALVAGEKDPQALAELARGKLRQKIPALKRALHGRVTPHHQFLLEQLLDHLAHLERQLASFTERIEVALRPFVNEATRQRLDTIPGVNDQTIQNVVAEIGVDMKQFPSAGHLASWAGVCPGNEESAGKRQRREKTALSWFLGGFFVP